MADAPSGKVSQNRTVMIVLAYLWLLALVPLLVEKEDAEVQWHAKNGLVLTAVLALFWVAKARKEERHLIERFPEYADYRRRTLI